MLSDKFQEQVAVIPVVETPLANVLGLTASGGGDPAGYKNPRIAAFYETQALQQ
jgi:hypothetical protein